MHISWLSHKVAIDCGVLVVASWSCPCHPRRSMECYHLNLIRGRWPRMICCCCCCCYVEVINDGHYINFTFAVHFLERHSWPCHNQYYTTIGTPLSYSMVDAAERSNDQFNIDSYSKLATTIGNVIPEAIKSTSSSIIICENWWSASIEIDSRTGLNGGSRGKAGRAISRWARIWKETNLQLGPQFGLVSVLFTLKSTIFT